MPGFFFIRRNPCQKKKTSSTKNDCGDWQTRLSANCQKSSNACGYNTTVNVDDWPDEEPVPAFGPRMRCSKCGHLGASVRPDWTQLRAAPQPPRR
jgi:hypothetical protein